MKKLGTFFVIIIAVLAVLFLAKNAIAKFAIEKGVTKVTGLGLTMDHFNLGIGDQLVQIKGLELENPDGFEEKTMVNLPEMFLQLDIPSFLKGKAHIKKIRLDLAEFAVIKNKEGKLNLLALKPVEGDKSKTPKDAKPKKASKPMDLQIDVVELKIGTVIYKDHSSIIGKATSKTFKLNINERYENITDPKVIVKAIVAKILKSTTLGQLTDINMAQFADVSKVLDGGKAIIGDAQAQAGELLKGAKDQINTKALESSKDVASEALAGAGDSVKDAADDLKGAAGNLLGSLKEKAEEVTS